jgi:beta-phosphoglucomutase family hydrolase
MSPGAREFRWPEGIKAVIFDMDGVVTDTASVHAAAWKRLFDEYLETRASQTNDSFAPFDPDGDYRRYIDGKARYDGVRDFLAARGISLPEGEPSDSPEAETVSGLGNRKNGYFLEHVRRHGADAYESTVSLVKRLRSAGVRTAIISASLNMSQVLEAAGVADLFGVRVDGVIADELGLPGKPDPAVFLEAARRLGVEPSQAAVVEDALAGVEAARRGSFALVIGVDRSGHPDALRTAGADLVVNDLGELQPPAFRGSRE